MFIRFIPSSIVLLLGTTIVLSSCGDSDESSSKSSKSSKHSKESSNDRDELDRLVYAPSPKMSLSEAIEKYVVRTDQTSVDSMVLAKAAEHAADAGDNDAAESLSTEAIRLDENNSAAYFQRGRSRCNAIAGKDSAAIEDLKKAISLGQQGCNAHLYLARLYDGNKEPHKAIDSLTYAMKISPTTKDLYRSRAALYVSLGEKEKALKDYEQLCKLDTTSLEYLFQMGQVLESMKRYDDARKSYERILKLDETSKKVPLKGISYKRIAYLDSKNGKHKEAIANLTEAMKFDVEDDEPLRLRGLEYAKLGDYEKAAADLTEAIEMAPESSSNFKARAEINSKLGRAELAEEDRVEAQRLHDTPAERPIYELKQP